MNQTRFFQNGPFQGFQPHNDQDPLHVMGCPSCKKKKKKYQAPDWPVISDSNMSGRGSWPCGHHHPELKGLEGRRLAGTQPPPPGVCCQLTEDGLSVICSDGQGFNSSCPVCPAPNMPGFAKYQQVGSQLIPIPPSPGSCNNPASGSASGSGSLLPILAIAGAGVLGYFLLK